VPKVLIVDDQPAVCKALKVLFEIHGVGCETAFTPVEALDKIHRKEIGVVIQDMNFGRDKTSGEEGVALFRQIRSGDPDLPILLITGWTSLETAVALIKEGAADYLAKPWDDEKLLNSVQNLLKMRQLQMENMRLYQEKRQAREALSRRYNICGVVYASEAMHRVISLAATIARSDVPVLITGPSGSGKEKIAEIIQANSTRSRAPFVRVNVGAIPDDLMESELFGAEPGAFTGSQKLRVGRFEAANGGTLFLDEVGNLSSSGQMKLLRVLQSGEFERLGSSSTRKVDVRILSATNTDLRRAISEGDFREDLYFRLQVIEIDVPPLHEHSEDILPLAEHFLREFSQGRGEPPPPLSPQAEESLLQYHWPGNVRELRNMVHRATLTRQRDAIEPEDLGIHVPSRPQPAGRPETAERTSGEIDPERARIEEALIRADGVVSLAASELGISRQAFYRKMEKFGIVLERRPKG
jgi:DNA-binding NtrC family response regulator